MRQKQLIELLKTSGSVRVYGSDKDMAKRLATEMPDKVSLSEGTEENTGKSRSGGVRKFTRDYVLVNWTDAVQTSNLPSGEINMDDNVTPQNDWKISSIADNTAEETAIQFSEKADEVLTDAESKSDLEQWSDIIIKPEEPAPEPLTVQEVKEIAKESVTDVSEEKTPSAAAQKFSIWRSKKKKSNGPKQTFDKPMNNGRNS